MKLLPGSKTENGVVFEDRLENWRFAGILALFRQSNERCFVVGIKVSSFVACCDYISCRRLWLLEQAARDLDVRAASESGDRC
jgi:hypothetical protein